MDIKSVGHADSATTLTYTFEAYSDVNWSYENAFITWVYDFDGDGSRDAYIEVGVAAPNSPPGTEPECNLYDPGQGAVAPCTQTTAGATVTVQLALSDLRAVGLGSANTYRYFVGSIHFSGAEDRAPDGTGAEFSTFYTHTLGAAPAATTTTTGASGSTTTTAAPATTTTTTAAPASSATGTVTDKTVRPGQQVTIAGDGFAPSTRLDAALNSTPIHMATFTSSATGTFSTLVTIPAAATPGAHTIVVSGTGANGGNRQVAIPVTVQGAPAGLPSTGARPATATSVGLVLLTAGLVLVTVTRQRRRVSASATRAASLLDDALR
jgi:hypothetical protein